MRCLGRVLGDLLAEPEMHMRIDQPGKDMQSIDTPDGDVLCHDRFGCHQRRDPALLAEDVQAPRFAVGADDRCAAQHKSAMCCPRLGLVW